MTTYDGVRVNIDPCDHKGMVELMDIADDFKGSWSGDNESGEHIQITISKDNIIVKAFQSNNWIRKNIYWRDGTSEELYER